MESQRLAEVFEENIEAATMPSSAQIIEALETDELLKDIPLCYLKRHLQNKVNKRLQVLK